nr:winged helix-turn-helix domain-containing protein [Serratia fonticola]
MGELHYDTSKETLFRGNDEIPLRAKEKDLLSTLIRYAPNYVSREVLCNEVWEGRYVSDFTINQTVNLLRKKMGDTDKTCIVTVPRKGYAISDSVKTNVTSPSTDVLMVDNPVDNDVSSAIDKPLAPEGRRPRLFFQKYSRRAFIMIALFFSAGGIGVGVAAITSMNKNTMSAVYVDGNRFDIYEDRVEYIVAEERVVCELVEGISYEKDRYITDKTACRKKV